MEKIETKPQTDKLYTATRNACKMCTPLGASVAFKGINKCIPLVHGSQGCSTYIRRYMISHYKEPVDIASTNFSEEAAIFGGERNMETALNNVIDQYQPEVVAIASTCLSETIGDDLHKMLTAYKNKHQDKKLPVLFFASTASYRGTHMDGFHLATLEMIRNLARENKKDEAINIFPGLVSSRDLRNIKALLDDFGLSYHMVPDYSETLDNTTWKEYKKLPDGGITAEELGLTGSASASVELGRILRQMPALSAGQFLEKKFFIPNKSCGLPIGIKETDQLINILKNISGKALPEKYRKERGRLVDAYIDGHKYLFGKQAVVYGEEDFVVGMVSFLKEIGIAPVLCASGGKSGLLRKTINEEIEGAETVKVMENADFEEIAEKCRKLKPDIMIGNSKGYYISRELNIPLVRVGFPIHDRLGGQRIAHLLYEGAQELFDKIANALIEYKQENSPVGYKYM